MGRPVQQSDRANKNHGKMHRSRAPRAVENRVAIRVVQIQFLRQESGDHEKRRGDGRLQRERAPVVTPEPPSQQFDTTLPWRERAAQDS